MARDHLPGAEAPVAEVPVAATPTLSPELDASAAALAPEDEPIAAPEDEADDDAATASS